jgi:hypothetical protein
MLPGLAEHREQHHRAVTPTGTGYAMRRPGRGCCGTCPVPGRTAGTCRPRAGQAARHARRGAGWRCGPAVAATGQRREQAWPSRPPAHLTPHALVPRGQRRPHGTDPASPRVTGVLAGPMGRRAVLPHHRIGGPQAHALLAVRAHQAADGIMSPPGGLAERCRIVVPRDAGSHLTPGGGPSDPVTQNSPLGDGKRPGQRVSAHPAPRQARHGNAGGLQAREPFLARPGNPALPLERPGVPGAGFHRHAGLPE